MIDDKKVKESSSKRLIKEIWRAVREVAGSYNDTVLKEWQKEAEAPAPEAQKPTAMPTPQEISPGSTVHSNNHVSFVLYAPGKKSVGLAGSFNEWQPAPMEHIGDGLWWRSMKLEPGEHLYQFVVDENLWICDPYAREVQWEGEGPKAVVQVGQQPYEWHDEGFHPRPLEDLIIYEVHVGDFSPEGSFDGMRERLDYLQGLGITALELMPVCEFPMDRSWGYNPAFFFASERAYGRPDDLKRLIDEAHQRGIAVILDMVFNHAQQDNPLNQMWPYEENPYFSGANPWGMPDFDHFSDVTKAFIRDVQDFWLREYHIDGFRYDATAYIESDVTSGIGFFTWAARQTNPNVYLISEHLPQDPWWIHNTEMDAQWYDTFHDVMKAQLREGVFEGNHQWGDLEAVERALFYGAGGYSHPSQVINYITSHDEERIVREAQTNPYLNEEIAYRKAKLGMTTVITAAGIPMLYAGEEIGMERERTTGEAKFEWERLEGHEAAKDIHRHWQRLTWIRNTHPALRSPNFQTLFKWGEQKAIAFQRWNDEGDAIVVVLNFSNESFHLSVPFPMGGRWSEYLYDYSVDVGDGGTADVEVPPSGALIFCLWKNW
ncbi:MAG: alpha amylase C-terminal domain-containing protein [Ardenticatenales bacterium]|nr:alpha amylase C-terminal domain-containing protein [Ardenticatenales bacterium]